MTYDECIEKLVVHFTQPPYDREVASAKADFFEQTGGVDDSTHFELRMSQFLDWYMFSRDLSNLQVTPVELSISRPPEWAAEGDAAKICAALGKTRHSLFEFQKIRGSDVYIKDLFSRKKVVVRDSPVTVGFSKDEIFEVRLIPTEENNLMFTKGFCFHPAEAKKYILKEIGKIRQLAAAEHEALMSKLLKMRYKHEQYAHIRIDYIYTNDSKLRI